MYKNIAKKEKITLADQIEYQAGQVVSKTLVQNDKVSMTLFSFDKGEEISTHAAAGDAMVTVLVTVPDASQSAERCSFLTPARRSSCPRTFLTRFTARKNSKCSSWSRTENSTKLRIVPSTAAKMPGFRPAFLLLLILYW